MARARRTAGRGARRPALGRRWGIAGQTTVIWLVAFVVAWKISRDQRLALGAATLMGAMLLVGLLLASARERK